MNNRIKIKRITDLKLSKKILLKQIMEYIINEFQVIKYKTK